MSFKYKAFISYSHTDRLWAEWLFEALENYKVPKNLVGRVTEKGAIPARLGPIFRDRNELPAADRLTERLFDAVRDSEFMIVLCSPDAAGSKLVNKEIAEFKRSHGEGNILSLIVGGQPFAADPSEECFPNALLHSYRADGAKTGVTAEGLAADLRADGDGKKMGLLKIIAGTLGVGLNDIVQREERRRQRKIAGFAAAGVFSMLVMGGLTYEAVEARRIAEAKSIESDERQAETKKLTRVLLESAYYRLLEAGSLEFAEQLVRQVADFYSDKDTGNLSVDEITWMSGAMLKLGQIYDRSGKSDKALAIFEDVRALSERLYAEHSDDVFAVHRMQNVLFFTGYLKERQGDLIGAEKDYRDRLAIIKNRRDLKGPEVAPWRTAPVGTRHWDDKIADAQLQLARLYIGPLARLNEGLVLINQSLIGRMQLLDAFPDERGLISDLASNYWYLSKALRFKGDYDGAINALMKRREIYEQLLAKGPENLRIIRRLAMTRQQAAAYRLETGQTEGVMSEMRAGAQAFDLLVKTDPSNTLWLADSGQAYLWLAETLVALGRPGEAESPLEVATQKIGAALERDASRIGRRLMLYRLRFLEATIQRSDRADGDLIATLTALDAELAREHEGIRQLPEAIELSALIRNRLGGLLAAAGNERKAEQIWRNLAKTCETAQSSLTPPTKYLLAQAYDQLEWHDAAAVLYSELNDVGYQFPGHSIGRSL